MAGHFINHDTPSWRIMEIALKISIEARKEWLTGNSRIPSIYDIYICHSSREECTYLFNQLQTTLDAICSYHIQLKYHEKNHQIEINGSPRNMTFFNCHGVISPKDRSQKTI